MNFVNFMDRLFIHRNNPSILKFRLSLAQSYDFSATAWMTHLSRWISSSAIMGNVEELIFSINFPFRLPENLYCCEKLVALKLHGHIRFDNLQSVCFPSLKALHLEHLRMLNNTAIKVLLSGSPALEELELKMEGRDSRRSVHVCSLSLKRLIIRFICIFVPYDHRYRRKLTIDTPNLEFLELVDFASEELSMQRADSLLQADLYFGYQTDVFNVGIEEYANMVVQFYRQISGVKTLSLSNFNIQVRSPPPPLLEYFLSNALVLKKMTITYLTHLKTLEVDVLKRLSTCPKGSDACQIVLVPYHKRSFEVASMRRASFFS
ncbi:hypothetical protein OIU78_025134 [Salix suchowensis]|nr:hypothetical protein OIU78_025134 [Salix suchowensis]